MQTLESIAAFKTKKPHSADLEEKIKLSQWTQIKILKQIDQFELEFNELFLINESKTKDKLKEIITKRELLQHWCDIINQLNQIYDNMLSQAQKDFNNYSTKAISKRISFNDIKPLANRTKKKKTNDPQLSNLMIKQAIDASKFNLINLSKITYNYLSRIKCKILENGFYIISYYDQSTQEKTLFYDPIENKILKFVLNNQRIHEIFQIKNIIVFLDKHSQIIIMNSDLTVIHCFRCHWNLTSVRSY